MKKRFTDVIVRQNRVCIRGLEPVAIRLDMWSWAGGNPPLQNYIAWFVVSFPLVMLLGKYTKGSENPLVPIVLICQLLFFGLLNVLIAFAGM